MKPRAIQYPVVAAGTVHLVHAQVLKDYQAALILYLLKSDVSFCSPCYLEQHARYNLDQSIHNIHAVASYLQALFLMQLLSAQTQEEQFTSIRKSQQALQSRVSCYDF